MLIALLAQQMFWPAALEVACVWFTETACRLTKDDPYDANGTDNRRCDCMAYMADCTKAGFWVLVAVIGIGLLPCLYRQAS